MGISFNLYYILMTKKSKIKYMDEEFYGRSKILSFCFDNI